MLKEVDHYASTTSLLHRSLLQHFFWQLQCLPDYVLRVDAVMPLHMPIDVSLKDHLVSGIAALV